MQGCKGAEVLGIQVLCARASARSASSFDGTGRADSTTGQSPLSAAEAKGLSDDGSCEGQCGFADSECSGVRHVASHQARAGAAAPTTSATMKTLHRFTKFSIS